MITKLSNLKEYLSKEGTKAKLVIGAASDKNVFEAVINAQKTGFINVILVGDSNKIEKVFKESDYKTGGIEIIDVKND
jgi:phosphotransacetylase